MVERREEEERERPSWREIDARKNRSRHVVQDPKPARKKSHMERRDDSMAKKALNEFFQGKKSKAQETEWKKVCEASGSLFSKRAKKYIEAHGLPRQWDDLLRLLDHDETALLKQVLDRLRERAQQQNEKSLDLLVGKLRILKMTCEEPKLLEQMDQLLHELSSRV